MPIYSYRCEKHGVFELSMRLADWNDKKPCPKKHCKQIAEQVILPNDGSRTFSEPVVVHVSADGSFRFPGSSDAKVPKGFEKKELRTIREIEAFERCVNTHLRAESEQHQINQEKHFAEMRSELRSELRMKMQGMSQYGKDLARLAMAMNDARRPQSTDAGFHLQILHFDQTNREAHRDERTNWKGRHG
jgi:putative FmdB family regulatory protein